MITVKALSQLVEKFIKYLVKMKPFIATQGAKYKVAQESLCITALLPWLNMTR